jgi:hypothetical protein
MNRFFHLPILILISTFFLIGCVRHHDKTVPPGQDTAVRVDKDQGLKIKLTNWSWRNYPANAEVKVQGSALNLTGKTIQGCRIVVDGYDHKGDLLSHTETFLQPTVLRPGAKASFNLSFDSPEEIQNIHLEYSFKARSEES